MGIIPSVGTTQYGEELERDKEQHSREYRNAVEITERTYPVTSQAPRHIVQEITYPEP